MRVGVKTESAASLYVQNMQVFGHGGVLMGEGSSRGGGTYSRDGLEVGGGCGGDTWWRVCARAANPCRTFSPVLGTNYLKKLSDVSPKRDRTPTRGLR